MLWLWEEEGEKGEEKHEIYRFFLFYIYFFHSSSQQNLLRNQTRKHMSEVESISFFITF